MTKLPVMSSLCLEKKGGSDFDFFQPTLMFFMLNSVVNFYFYKIRYFRDEQSPS